ncbi:MAG: glycosyl transferase, partial [Gammaproteobacteria bacterium HGW-Gammaproteobacteria-7]
MPAHVFDPAWRQATGENTARMRFALVTETYPPEINGVALTVHALETGLRRLGHDVTLVRPRQGSEDAHTEGALCVPGLPVPRYPGLRFGLPA